LQLSNSSHIKKVNHSSKISPTLRRITGSPESQNSFEKRPTTIPKTNEYITGEQLKLDQVIGV
jgi:hypothetical protein